MKKKEIRSLTEDLGSSNSTKKIKLIDTMISKINDLLFEDHIKDVTIDHINVIQENTSQSSSYNCLIITIIYTIYYQDSYEED